MWCKTYRVSTLHATLLWALLCYRATAYEPNRGISGIWYPVFLTNSCVNELNVVVCTKVFHKWKKPPHKYIRPILALGKINLFMMSLLLELLWFGVNSVFKINMRTKRHFSMVMFCRAELVVYNLLGVSIYFLCSLALKCYNIFKIAKFHKTTH